MLEIKYESMTDENIKFYLPDARLILYNDLKKYKTIEQLLPKHKSYFILLYPVSSETNGHWTVLTRFDNVIEYFDSYGLRPDVPFSWDSSKFRDNKKYLTGLLNKTNLKVVFNDISFQSKRDGMIATCGSFVVFRVLTLIEFGADLKNNNKMLKTLKKVNENLTYDDIVIQFIDKR